MRYYTHFQPRLRLLHLETQLMDPWNLVSLGAPILEEATIDVLNTRDLPALRETGPEWLEPAALLPFRAITPVFVG